MIVTIRIGFVPLALHVVTKIDKQISNRGAITSNLTHQLPTQGYCI